MLTVTLDDGRGGALEVLLGGSPPPRGTTEYVSPDGRVRVEIDD